MAVGPIPWRDIREYARDQELDETSTMIFVQVIMAMDEAYLEIVAKKREKK